MSERRETGYFSVILTHPQVLAFGFLMAFGSSFGQTYFVGVFSPSIQAEFGLSHTEWGVIYMGGTLCSAALLVGRKYVLSPPSSSDPECTPAATPWALSRLPI